MPRSTFFRAKRRARGLAVRRFFTSARRDPLEAVRWTRRRARISDADGSVVFQMDGVEVPESWSQLATDILASKYCRPTTQDASRRETGARAAIRRVSRTVARAAAEQGLASSSADARGLEAELAHLLVTQTAAFNTPVWLNLGLAQEYGLEGPRGNWAWNVRSGRAEPCADAYARPQCSACFIQSIDDSLAAIFDLLKSEARIFKYGSGSGSNFSRIRSRFEKLSTGGSPSGLMFFLEVFDKGAGAIKSGGIGRRAAKMVCLDMDHPEIADFIQWKQREEKKVAVMVAAGYPADFNGEAYRTVSGQNSNNSVRMTDSFLRAVEAGGEWATTLRKTGKVHERRPARELMGLVASAAWSCADPGVQFDDTINRFHTCPAADRIRASNPCSEFMFLDDTACNLASLNLLKFLRDDRSFDVDGFRAAVRVLVLAQDALVDFSSYPSERIAANTHAYRPLGLGYANLGTLLMALGLPYDSPAARGWCGALTALMTGEAYRVSAELARAFGPFEGLKRNKEAMLRVLKLQEAALARVEPGAPADLLDAAAQAWAGAIALGRRWGWRNAQVSALAPTGTIGLLMDCDTTGIEPDFALVKAKKLAGGGSVRIVNGALDRALRSLGYGDEDRRSIVEHALRTGGAEGAPGLKPEHQAVFDCASPAAEGGRCIPPMGHVRMIAAAQPFISGAISKTVNLPRETTVAEIEKIFLESWRLGLKAVSVYRDGCKLSQPLTVSRGEAAGEVRTATAILEHRYLPQKRSGHTYEAAIAGHRICVRTGEYPDGRLGEVFVDFQKSGSPFQELLNCFSAAVSLGLQYGVPLEELVQRLTFTRFEPAGPVRHPNIKSATSVVDFVFRLLALEYLGRADLAHVPPSGAAAAAVPAAVPAQPPPAPGLARAEMSDAPFCDACGHVTVRSGTCYKCLNCGSSLGCS